MEEAIQKLVKKPNRRTRKQIVKLLKEYESMEGVTVVDFCKLQNVKKSNFYNWQKRYGSNQKHDKPKGFVPLQLTPSLPSSNNVPSLFAEVKGIRLYQVVSAEYLKVLGS